MPYGAVIVRSGTDEEPRHLLEKIIFGQSLPADGKPVQAGYLQWKREATIIVVGSDISILDEFAKLVSGFKRLFGKPRRVNK